jgi:two-component system chemotaxis sensor kinase CheA
VSQFNSLRNKFVRTMLLVTGIIGVATLTIVVFMSTQASSQHLRSVEHYIEEGITSKGKVLTENHALALRSLTLDNAFLDMQGLVERAVKEDADLYYGLYVNSQAQTLAYTRRGAPSSEERAPEEHAYRELGLTEGELIVKAPKVKRVVRLDRDLLEFAVPVVGEDREVIGTIRYGLSTARMQDALARAKGEARSRLTRTLALVGSLVGVAVVIGLLLSRMQGGKITRPITDLTLAAQGLAAGNRAVRVKIESRDELEILGASFNRMVEDLDASYRNLEEMNRTLEQKVEQRTTELARKNRDMRLVLDNVDQGFATLSPDGVMGLERSRVVSRWFGECDEPVEFWKYMARSAPDFALTFRLAWEQVMDDVLPLETALSQLPRQVGANGRSFELEYLPFNRGERLEGVLVVIADTTERLAKAREEAEQRELVNVFKTLMLDRGGFDTFLREAHPVVQGVVSRKLESDRLLLKRSLHTLKGNAASMGLTVVAELCHKLEDQLAENDTMSEATVAELSSRWTTICQHFTELSGASVEKVVEVPATEYAALVTRVLAETQIPTPIVQQILDFRLERVGRPLQRLADQARTLARRLRKGEIDVVVQSDGVRVDPERFSAFFSDLVHVIRNAVDHGLEYPEERKLANKPARGKIVLAAHAAADVLTFEISDDGRGVDWEAIRARAEHRGLPARTPSELLRALCHDGVTTREGVTAVSGRGVGMAAIQQRVDALEGIMEVRSTPGAGSTWIFKFPTPSAEVSSIKLRRTPSIRMAVRGAEGRR